MTAIEYLDRIDELDREVARLISGCSPEQLCWQPAPHRWSMAQNFDHLGITGEQYLVVLEPTANQARRTSQPKALDPSNPFAQYFLRTLEPPVKLKLKAPKKIAPAPQLDPDAARARMLTVHQRLRGLVTRNLDADPGASMVTPFIPLIRMRIGTVLLIMWKHTQRHLWQCEQVRTHPDFPRP